MTRKPDKTKAPVPAADEVLIEDNRFTPFGAMPESNPADSFTGAPNDSHGKKGNRR